MDALWFGCIPVIIADHYVPPLADLVEWESIAVFVAEKQVGGGGRGERGGRREERRGEGGGRKGDGGGGERRGV